MNTHRLDTLIRMYDDTGTIPAIALGFLIDCLREYRADEEGLARGALDAQAAAEKELFAERAKHEKTLELLTDAHKQMAVTQRVLSLEVGLL